jgi:hypothetical protein
MMSSTISKGSPSPSSLGAGKGKGTGGGEKDDGDGKGDNGSEGDSGGSHEATRVCVFDTWKLSSNLRAKHGVIPE